MPKKNTFIQNLQKAFSSNKKKSKKANRNMGKDTNSWFPAKEIEMASNGEMSNLMSNQRNTKLIISHFFIHFKLGEMKKVYTT